MCAEHRSGRHTCVALATSGSFGLAGLRFGFSADAAESTTSTQIRRGAAFILSQSSAVLGPALLSKTN